MRVTTRHGVTYGKPVLDGRGRPITEKVKFAGREVDSPVTEHVRLSAGAVVDLDEDTAKEWIANGYATVFDPVLDADLPVEDGDASKGNGDTSKQTSTSTDPLG